MFVIPATQEAETGKSETGQSKSMRSYLNKQTKNKLDWGHSSSNRARPEIQSPVTPKK
jgi:hypothetical protein